MAINKVWDAIYTTKIYLDLAIRTAEKSTQRQRLGAVIIDDLGTVLSTGCNSLPESNILNKYKVRPAAVGTHAEIQALKNLHDGYSDLLIGKSIDIPTFIDYKLSNSVLLVVRLHKDGTLAMARPCIGCARAYFELTGLRDVVYTNERGVLTVDRIENLIKL